MATAADYLQAAYNQACQRLSELDVLPVSQRVKATYTTDDGRSMDWNGYREHLLSQIKELGSAPAGGSSLIQQAQGPFEVWS